MGRICEDKRFELRSDAAKGISVPLISALNMRATPLENPSQPLRGESQAHDKQRSWQRAWLEFLAYVPLARRVSPRVDMTQTFHSWHKDPQQMLR